MLRKMIQNYEKFNDFTREKQEITMALAQKFEENPTALYYSPVELRAQLSIGNLDQWQDFLNLEPVRSYIKAQMGFHAQIAQRKAFHSLEREAIGGDVQAARQINELSGILANADQNRIIVLHQIERSNQHGDE
jgi:hypothetical protein